MKKRIPKKVKLINIVDRHEMPSHYVSYDAMLGGIFWAYSPSIEREAIACGVPIFHYDEMGFTNNDPFYHGEKNPEDIAKYIDKIVTDKEFRDELKKTQFEWINKVFDNKKLTHQWETVLTEAIEKKRKKAKRSYNLILKLSSKLNLK